MIKREKTFQFRPFALFGEREPHATCSIHGQTVRIRGFGTLYCTECSTDPFLATKKTFIREKRP